MTDTTTTTGQVDAFLSADLSHHQSDAIQGASSHFISRSSSQSMTSVTADLSSQTPLLCASEQPVQPVTASFHSRRPGRRKRTLRDTLLRKRLRLLRMFKCGLEAFIAGWTVFNIARYLVSYSKYVTSQGQVAALALALSACLSLAFLGCAVLLSISRKYLKRRIPPRASHVIRKSIRSIAAFLIFAPALANVVFLFLWKDSDDPEISFKSRCHVDIDLVWSAFQDQCSAPAWGVWLALGLVRLAITLVVLAAYLIVSLSYGRTLKLSTAHRLSALAPYETTIVPSSATPMMKETPTSQRHSKHRPSHSTLNSNVESISPSVLPYHSPPIARATSSTSSEDEYAMRHPPPGLVYSTEKATDNHFRTTSQDTDDTLSHSRLSDEGDEDEHTEDYSSQPTSYAPYTAYPPLYTSHSPYSYNLPPVPPSIGYNEFGQPYPPDEPLSVLHGIIRRMPTIESMGSRELGSVVTSSSGPNVENRVPGSARSTMTFERPPTRPISRTDLVSSNGGGASTTTSSSRPNSLGARAELMAGLGGTITTELGELVGGQQGRSTMEESPVSRATTTASTSRSSTLSFHTATSGSMYSGSH
ncbi:hypothetical protein JOM56_011116 [Amanita muscaria]